MTELYKGKVYATPIWLSWEVGGKTKYTNEPTIDRAVSRATHVARSIPGKTVLVYDNSGFDITSVKMEDKRGHK